MKHLPIIFVAASLLCACGDGCGRAGDEVQSYPLACPEERSLWRAVEGSTTRYWCVDQDEVADGPTLTLQEERVILEGAFWQGFAHGVWRSYDTSERLILEREFARGVRCGTWKTYVMGTLTETTSYTPCDEVLDGAPSQPVDGAPTIEILDPATACDGAPMIEESTLAESTRRYCEGGGPYQIARGEQVLVQGELDSSLQHVGETYGFDEAGHVRWAGVYTRPSPGTTWSNQDELAQPSGLFSFFGRSGALEARGTLEQGNRVGEWTLFWLDGTPKQEGSYVDGLRDGVWTDFTPRGDIITQQNWVMGSKSGDFSHYHPNGQLQARGAYSAGKRSGDWEFYDQNGELRAQGKMDRDLRDGPWSFFDASSRPLIDAVFRQGLAQGTWIYHYYPADGQQREEATYLDDKAHGIWKGFWVDGDVPIYEQQWLDDAMNGPFVSWYRNGQKQREGQFSENISQGLWRWWHENGQLHREGEVLDDVPLNSWTTYHPNGQRASEGEYEGLSGRKKEGWRYWDENGNLLAEEP